MLQNISPYELLCMSKPQSAQIPVQNLKTTNACKPSAAETDTVTSIETTQAKAILKNPAPESVISVKTHYISDIQKRHKSALLRAKL